MIYVHSSRFSSDIKDRSFTARIRISASPAERERANESGRTNESITLSQVDKMTP